MNIGGLLSVHQFVSHITGASGVFARALHLSEWQAAASALSFPLFFLFGSFLSGAFIEVRRRKDLPPIYLWVTLLISLIYLLIAALGSSGFLGQFGEPLEGVQDFVVVALLCLACGIQNALFTQASGAVVRTTHLTGITTDLGIGLARVLFKTDEHHKEMTANKLRIGIILSFLAGSLFGVPLFFEWEFATFLLPAAMSFFICLRLYRSRKRYEVVPNLDKSS